ncbi:unnamed protein product [Haemonchus placei]|uniref:Dolichyl-diphosphooligosaccharide--protein glycosyltransferase subunit 2 n=1 Tax=Haemonchus placei TaxID=6290 RepID=A0A158QJL3_HAEPC|nr:unnamed protein product [Haemonchus placei]
MRPIVFLVLTFTTACAVSLNTYWDDSDTKRLSKVLENVLVTKKDNIAALHFAASGLKLLNVAPPADKAKGHYFQAACEIAKKADLTKLDVLYHASALSGDLTDCALTGIAEAQKTIEAVLTAPNPNGERITQALRSADRLNIKVGFSVDKAAFDKLLATTLKDDSPNNLAWVFNAAALLDKAQGAKYFDKIKNLVSQADEVDGRFLQFDGGLTTTSNAIHGIMSLAEQQGKVPAVSKDQLLLFTNYLLSRKHVSTEKAAFHLLSALGVLVNNHQLVPVVAARLGPVMIHRMKPIVIAVCNVFGLPITVSGVRVDITPEGGSSPVMGNLPLTPSQALPILFSFGPDKMPDSPGFYTVNVKAESQDKRLVGLTSSSITLKLSDEVMIEDFKVGALEKDDVVSGANLASVAQFSKYGKVLSADSTKRLYMSFSVKSKVSNRLVQPHQAFILFKHVNGAEVFYTADVQTGGKYLVDINLAKAHKDFEGISGKYTAYLVIGDATIKTPINWPFADFVLSLPPAPVEVVPKSQRINYDKLPEIKHIFRQPEKRPSTVVSDAFTLICLAPLLLLFVLWLRIGLNFGNMPLNVWTLIFHGSLAALFALYFVFWLQLNMFETLKYLAVVGGLTYLAGNRVLRAIANKRKSFVQAERIRRNEEIWANPDSIVHRLPEHYCKRYWDNLLRDATPVHYRPPTSRLYWDPVRKVEVEAENFPLYVIYPPEADKGLWGGEGVVKGWKESRPYTKKKILPRHWVPHLYFPALRSYVLYSEILDKHLKVTVTERALRLIDENFGLDYYILRTPEIDLASKLKREMLLTLAKETYYPEDEERHNYIKQKYKEFVIPAEEADWVGLDLNEAARKQQEIEESQVPEPLKYKFERELIARLRAGKDLIANEEEFAPKTEESKFGERLLGKYLNPVARRFRR